MKTWKLAVLSLLLFSCKQDQPNQQVAKELLRIYNLSLENINHPYHNSRKADLLLKNIQGIPSDMAVQAKYDAGLELLKAGRNQECIDLIEPVIKNKKISFSNRPYFRLLANAYLRKGEQDNCFHRSGINVCTIPFTMLTRHKDYYGSTNAMRIYEKLLTQNPNDLESKWLYNLAALTLGVHSKLDPQFKIDFNLEPEGVQLSNIFHDHQMLHAGGASLEDFDQDGDLDIFCSSYHLDENVNYYINEGGSFTDITEQAGLLGITGGLNFLHADVDNNGYEDILILRGGWLQQYGQYPLSLLMNQGDNTFIDQAKEWNLDFQQPTQSAVFTDIDLDGRLDLVLGAESVSGLNIPLRILKNTGNGFEDITESSNVRAKGYIKGITAGYVNSDPYPDIYISFLDGPNQLWINNYGLNSKINFKEKAEVYGVINPIHSFPCWFFDVNNDGFDDLFVSAYNIDDKQKMMEELVLDFYGDTSDYSHPKLYINNVGTSFEDATDRLGLNREAFTMGANFEDIDGNGNLDIYLGTGEFDMWSVMPNQLYMNDGNRFIDRSFQSGLAMIQKGHAVAFGDIDSDGDPDLFHTIGGAVEGDIFMNYLYENSNTNSNFIQFKLIGDQANKSAIGTRLKICYTIDNTNKCLFRTIGTGGSFGNNSLLAEIGIEKATKIDSIIIDWPLNSKKRCIFEDLNANIRYTIRENECKLSESGILE